MKNDLCGLIAGGGAIVLVLCCVVLAFAAYPDPNTSTLQLIAETRRQNTLEFYAILIAVVSVVTTGLGLFAKLTRFISAMEQNALQLRSDLERLAADNNNHRIQNETAAREIFQRLAHLEGRLDHTT